MLTVSTTKESRLSILSSKKNFFQEKERFAIQYMQPLQAICTKKHKKKQKALYREGKRKLRKGAVTATEFSHRHRVLSVGLSIPT